MKKNHSVVESSNKSKSPQPKEIITTDKVSPFKYDILTGAVLLLVTVIFYWPILSLSGTIWNDFIEQYLPYRMFATRALKALTFPFWNPYSFSGMPFFADLQSAVLYPFNLLIALFGSKTGTNAVFFEYQIIFHIFLAAFCNYLLARSFNISRQGSLIAGIAYAFSGFATTHIFHITMIHALPWIPLSLFLLRKALAKSNLIYTVLCGLALSMIAFAGHPQMFLYVHYFLGAYLVYHLYETWKNSRAVKKLIQPILLFTIAVIIGAGTSAVQLLPVKELSSESVRPEMSFDQASEGSFRPYRFITMVVPNFFGIPNRQGPQQVPYWGLTSSDVDPGSHYYWETALYPGILPLAFAIAAPFLIRSSPVIFFSIVSLLTFFIALGESGGLFHLAYSFFPGFKMFRNPARIAVIFSLAVSMSAAFGFDWFTREPAKLEGKGRKRFLLITGIIAAITVFIGILFSSGAFKTTISDFIVNQGIFGRDSNQIAQYVNQMLYPFALNQVWIFVFFTLTIAATLFAIQKKMLSAAVASILLIIVTMSDFLSFGYGFAADKTDPATLYTSNDLISSMKNEYTKELFRFNSRNSAPGRDDISGGQMIFKRNEGTAHELFLMEGYNPLRLKRQILDRKDKALDILNVKYKIDADNSSGRIGIAPHPTAFPRVWFANAYKIETDEKQILPDLYDQTFNHKSTIILEEKPGFSSGNPDSSAQANVTLSSWGLNRIQTEVTSDKPGFVVLSEIYYPAWKALVDGKPVKLYRADYALRAIPVPEGKHTVVCEYNDSSFATGLKISLATIILGIGLGCAGYFMQNRKQGIPATTTQA